VALGDILDRDLVGKGRGWLRPLVTGGHLRPARGLTSLRNRRPRNRRPGSRGFCARQTAQALGREGKCRRLS
jgi:hypothetical protein